MIDDFKHQGKRQQMISLLEELGISDKNLLDAMNKIPRHLFINSAFEEFAYQNTAFPIEANQTISQPFTVAFQTQLLSVKPNEKVLEIGTGSGYQTAVLVALGCVVYTIERQKLLFESSRKLLAKLHFKPKYQTFGDGYQGLVPFAPFDKILVTAGSETIPDELLNQLKMGGILLIPIGTDTQIMTSFQKKSETEFERKEHGNYKFVPMLKDTNK
jgi:protein-L-isoaspartate(D-aspartate) O-methyltransferase